MPLMFDMPMKKLKTYKGTNPRPKDFDRFWDKGIREMHALDPKVTLVPASFTVPYAECFDLYFYGVGGARVHAMLLRPKRVAKRHPAVVMFHGYTTNAGDWQTKLPFVALGFTVAALDCRGQGGQSEDTGGTKGATYRGHIIRGLDDTPDKLLFRQIFLDTAQLARIVMEMDDVDPARVGAMGGSQGGGLTLACAALEPRIKRAVPASSFLCDYRRVWNMDLAKNAYEELGTYFRQFDLLHEREDAIFTKLGYIDVQHLACRIRARILWGIGLQDQVCPPSTQFAAYNKIKSRKELVVYPDFGHEALPGFADRTLMFLADL
ncbi:MAG: alpha/beta fold hydrolase [Planctomycetota bacterium]